MTGRRTRRPGTRVAMRRGALAATLVGALAMVATGGDAEAEDCLVLFVPGCGEPPAATTTTTTVVEQAPPPPTTTTTTAPPPTTTTTTVLAPSAAAARLLELVNQERVDASLPPLASRSDVVDIAQAWSGELARRGSLAHNDEYFTRATRKRLGARSLGENVAYAGDPETAHRTLMNSSGHRANILNGRFLVVGIGAVHRDGRWWFTQDFLEPAAAPVAAPDSPPRSVPPAATPTDGAKARGGDAPRSAPPAPVVEADGATGGAPKGKDVVLELAAPPLDGGDGHAGIVAPLGDSGRSGISSMLAALALSLPMLVVAAHVRTRALVVRRSIPVPVRRAWRRAGAVADRRPVPARATSEQATVRAALHHQVAVIEAVTVARDAGRQARARSGAGSGPPERPACGTLGR